METFKDSKPMAVAHITNTMGIAVIGIIPNGVDDKVFGYMEAEDMKIYFYVKVKYGRVASFRVGDLTFKMDELIRY